MKFGYFDDARREYVITRPDTPLPWINYLGCEDYFGLISNTAGGYSFYKDARLRRLTRYRYNNAPLDMGGRYLYLRDNASGVYWSPIRMPTRSRLIRRPVHPRGMRCLQRGAQISRGGVSYNGSKPGPRLPGCNKATFVDSQPVMCGVVPLFASGEHVVEVILGN